MFGGGKMKCGEKIKYYREMLGMSQDELARKIGYAGRSAISRIEQGQRDLTQSKVIEFARALGVDPIELVDDREPTVVLKPIVVTEKQKLLEFVEQLPDDQIATYKALLEMPIERLQAVADLLRR